MALTSTQKSIISRAKLDADGLKELRNVYVPKDSGKELKAKVKAFVASQIDDNGGLK